LTTPPQADGAFAKIFPSWSSKIESFCDKAFLCKNNFFM